MRIIWIGRQHLSRELSQTLKPYDLEIIDLDRTSCMEVVKAHPVSALLVDAGHAEVGSEAFLSKDLVLLPAPLVVYFPFSPLGVENLKAIVRTRAPSGFICAGLNDRADDIYRELRSAALSAVAFGLYDALCKSFPCLSTSAQLALSRLIREPAEISGVEGLACEAAMSKRSLNRSFADAKVSAQKVIRAARLANVIDCLRMRLPLTEALARSGVGNRQILLRYCRLIFGVPSLSSVLKLSIPDLVQRLATSARTDRV